MGMPKGHTVVSIVVPIETRDRLHELAKSRYTSITQMLAKWLQSGVDAPIEKAGKRQAVRAHKDELMISLPRDWQRRTGITKGDRVTISYSDDALIIRA